LLQGHIECREIFIEFFQTSNKKIVFEIEKI